MPTKPDVVISDHIKDAMEHSTLRSLNELQKEVDESKNDNSIITQLFKCLNVT